jgi:hypothetical protein
MKTVFVVVENTWPEGFGVHGMFATLDDAVASVAKSKQRISKNSVIEEIPMGVVLGNTTKLKSFELGSILDNVITIHSLSGQKTFPSKTSESNSKGNNQ